MAQAATSVEEKTPHQNLMATLEKAAQDRAKGGDVQDQTATQTDTGQSEPQTEVAKKENVSHETPAEEKVETENVVKEKVSKEKPKKEKFWASKENVSTEEKVETVNYEAKYKESEAAYNKRIADLEAKINSESYKRFEALSENGGNIEDIISDIANTNPNKKTFDQLLRDRTVRSLAKMYGEDKVTEDLIEEQLELVKTKDAVTLDDMVEAEKKFQLDNFNSKIEKFKSPKSREVETFAKELDDIHNSIVGKEVFGLPVTKDRQDKMNARLDSYSKGEKLSGKDLYEALFFLEHKAEIFDNVLDTYGNERIEETIAKVKGSEIRVGNTRTTDMGAVKTPEIEAYEGLRDSVGATARKLEQRGQQDYLLKNQQQSNK